MKLKRIIHSNKEFLYFFGTPLLFILVLRILGFDGLYGQDSYEYLRYTESIRGYFINGTLPGTFYWPVLYPFLASLLSFVFGDTIFALQFISSISLSISAIYLTKTIQLLYPNHRFSFYYIMILGVFSPFLFKMSLVVMSDVMAAMFIVLSFYCFFKAYINGTNLALFFLFATCAFMTRYASLFITLPIILYSIYLTFKRKTFKDLLIASILSFIVCIPFITFQRDNLLGASSNYFLNSWSFLNYFSANHTTSDGLRSYNFPNLIHSFYIFVHPGFVFIGLLLGLISIKKRKLFFSFPQKIIFISIALYLLFLSGIPFQNIRVLGLLFPIVLLLFYPSFLELMNFKILKNNAIILGVFSVLIQLSLWGITFKHTYNRTLFEKKVTTALIPYQGKNLYSFDVDSAIQGRGLNFEYKNLIKKIYNDFRQNDLVLFHPTKFSKQWTGKKPIINWDYLKTNYHLEILEELPNGWKLYQIQLKQ
ncbi:ArnT family glycosyltransferase [Aquimarina sp. 2201CG14-23]|uniref:ArnT family glycosyltransferase n=1 Tax=Aquimarina mycalae TaxID=3040073 RepID=UPI0024781E9B|nr:glycosyltransferase family 39 protein [Aquimarina sp. 2201CG14-23]MDH7448051.1 glycosyltransferase family 39 protein [Aquimarina sp. 2201CG14-23]